jgi:uncharacterized membrane protein
MPPKIEIVAHPPERRPRGTTLVAAGCCCCCCCCLHSVGSVVGALVGGAQAMRRPAPEGVTAQEASLEHLQLKSADRYVMKTYWLAVLVVAIIGSIVTVVENRGNDGIVIALFVIALGLPFGQLIASVLTLIYLNVFPHPRKPDSLKRLGKITLYSFIGGLIGTAVMAALIPVMK